MAISSSSSSTKHTPQAEVETIKCHSCGFTEDCTPAYISRVRDRYQGRWICGLCVEAVKDEVLRSDRLISNEEALNRHISFCQSFKRSTPLFNQMENPIFVMGKVFRRSLDSHPRGAELRSNSSNVLPGVDEVGDGPRWPPLVRSGSCFPPLSR